MAKHALMAFLLLAGTLASPVRADDPRYGTILIEAPGNWTLSLIDREEEAGSPYKFPWYENAKIGNNNQVLNWGKLLTGRAGSFSIWPVGGTDVKLLGNTSENYELKGGTQYMVAFDYGLVGIKSFKHVLYLYSKEKSAFLVKVETEATGSTLKVNLLAQADYDPGIQKFKAGKNGAYQFTANGTLVKPGDVFQPTKKEKPVNGHKKAEKKDSSPYFISVKEIRPGL